MTIDYETGTAVTTHEDGQIVERRVHPVTGQPTWIKVGAAYMKMEYNTPTYDCTSIEDSAGNWVKFEYNKDGEIVNLTANDGQKMAFAYHETQKK